MFWYALLCFPMFLLCFCYVLLCFARLPFYPGSRFAAAAPPCARFPASGHGVCGASAGAAYSKDNKCITNWRDPATWVHWNFIVEEPGVYSVKVDQANDGYAGSTYEVIVGENAIAGKVTNTRDWSRFVEVELGTVNLPEQGIYTLTVKPRGTAKMFIMNLRSVTLTKK